MLPKFSLVSIGVHDEILNWVAKYKPVSIIIVSERGQSRPERPWENNEIDGIRKAMNASPKTLWIMRSWPDGIGENIPDWPLWNRLIKCFEPFRKMPNPLMAHGYNEPGFPWVNTISGAQALANIENKFAQRIHDVGLLYGGMCLPESHLGEDEQYLWEYLAPALVNLDALGFHEYDKPDSPSWLWRGGDFKYRLGHWEHQYEAIRKVLKHNEAIPPVILGEGIIDRYHRPQGKRGRARRVGGLQLAWGTICQSSSGHIRCFLSQRGAILTSYILLRWQRKRMVQGWLCHQLYPR